MTWTHITGHGLPEGDWGRAGVAVRRETMTTRVSDLWRRKRKKAGCSGRTTRERRGKKRRRINGSADLVHEQNFRDPRNADIVYVPSQNLYRSNDGGHTLGRSRARQEATTTTPSGSSDKFTANHARCGSGRDDQLERWGILEHLVQPADGRILQGCDGSPVSLLGVWATAGTAEPRESRAAETTDRSRSTTGIQSGQAKSGYTIPIRWTGCGVQRGARRERGAIVENDGASARHFARCGFLWKQIPV